MIRQTTLMVAMMMVSGLVTAAEKISLNTEKSKIGFVGTIRCAFYTRKSTEEGLDQQYNSLAAQRDAGEAYIRSQTNEG